MLMNRKTRPLCHSRMDKGNNRCSRGLGWFLTWFPLKVRVINARKKGIFCRMEWVAETHRNMCIIMCVLRHSGDCGRDKMASSTEEDEEERPAYRRISSNPSGRILLKDDQNILPAAEMPELTIRTSECSHQSYSAFRRSIFSSVQCLHGWCSQLAWQWSPTLTGLWWLSHQFTLWYHAVCCFVFICFVCLKEKLNSWIRFACWPAFLSPPSHNIVFVSVPVPVWVPSHSLVCRALSDGILSVLILLLDVPPST